MILNRDEFADLWNKGTPEIRLGDPDSILWSHERSDGMKQSQWFVKVAPLLLLDNEIGTEYFEWNNQMLIGQVLCYSSSEEKAEEWWGFTHYEDILLWKLRWEGR
jgi:hypothetical protein